VGVGEGEGEGRWRGFLFQGIFKLPITCWCGKIWAVPVDGAWVIGSYSAYALKLAHWDFNHRHRM
jgi:hypothetical protein